MRWRDLTANAGLTVRESAAVVVNPRADQVIVSIAAGMGVFYADGRTAGVPSHAVATTLRAVLRPK